MCVNHLWLNNILGLNWKNYISYMIRKKLEKRNWSTHKPWIISLYCSSMHNIWICEQIWSFASRKKVWQILFWYSIFFVFQTTEVPSTVKTEIKIECLDGNCNNNTPKDDNQKSKPRKGVEQKSSKKELDNPKIIDLHKSDDDGDHVKGRKGMNPGNF